MLLGEHMGVEVGDPLLAFDRSREVLQRVAERLGYRSPADLAEHYPRFFWQAVEPHLGEALQHLSRTVEGKQWIANLYAHVFAEEHRRERLGPQRGD